MSYNHRKAGAIRVICTDSYHHDTKEFREKGHHLIGTLVLAHRPGFADADFRWYGPREAVGTVETRDRRVPMSLSPLADPPLPVNLGRGRDGGITWLTKLPSPVKLWRTGDDGPVWKFRCAGPSGCYRNVQRHEKHIPQIVTQRAQADPEATRIDLDITTIH